MRDHSNKNVIKTKQHTQKKNIKQTTPAKKHNTKHSNDKQTPHHTTHAQHTQNIDRTQDKHEQYTNTE